MGKRKRKETLILTSEAKESHSPKDIEKEKPLRKEEHLS